MEVIEKDFNWLNKHIFITLLITYLTRKYVFGSGATVLLFCSKHIFTFWLVLTFVSLQLLDLGFEEEQIVDALLKHDNDRDKALEELIA